MYKRSTRLNNVQDKDQDCFKSLQLDFLSLLIFKNLYNYADRTKATLLGCVGFDLRAHIDRRKFFDFGESLRRREKTEPRVEAFTVIG